MAKKEKKVKEEEINIDDNDIVSDDIESTTKIKKQKVKKEKKEKTKKKSKLVPIFIFIFLLGGIGLIIFFNTFGLRNKYIVPLVQKIPIIKNIFPLTEEEMSATKPLTNEELIAKNAELEKQVENLIKENEVLDKKSTMYSEEVLRLQDIEYQQLSFKKDKEQFDTLVASGDKKAFIQFYESISKENADKLYKEAVVSTQQTKEMKNFTSTFSSMDESKAAKIMEEMIPTDMNLVVDILKNVGTDTSAAILGAMETKNAASVAKRIAPDKNLESNQ